MIESTRVVGGRHRLFVLVGLSFVIASLTTLGFLAQWYTHWDLVTLEQSERLHFSWRRGACDHGAASLRT